MKKIFQLGAKTGLTGIEVGRVVNFGVLGLLAAGLAALSGCLGFQRTRTPEPAEKPQTLQTYSGASSVPSAAPSGFGGSGSGSADQAPAPAPKPKAADDCGPYPGYPCGTRYYTVSRADLLA
ncbi:MAG TPA: hypothetical protein PKI19_03370 [Elusimicrobiales bacterium]|nr:hypothetical protein [Elusimicrobiales bacterium]